MAVKPEAEIGEPRHAGDIGDTAIVPTVPADAVNDELLLRLLQAHGRIGEGITRGAVQELGDEVLQGIRTDSDYRKTRDYFDSLIFLPMTRDTFILTAQLNRSLRQQGITIRKPVDCMIAAVAIEHNLPLLHNNRDFDPLAMHCGLKVVESGAKPSKPSGRRTRRRN